MGPVLLLKKTDRYFFQESICKKFDVKGFPTIKYFKDGQFAFDAGDAR